MIITYYKNLQMKIKLKYQIKKIKKIFNYQKVKLKNIYYNQILKKLMNISKN